MDCKHTHTISSLSVSSPPLPLLPYSKCHPFTSFAISAPAVSPAAIAIPHYIPSLSALSPAPGSDPLLSTFAFTLGSLTASGGNGIITSVLVGDSFIIICYPFNGYPPLF